MKILTKAIKEKLIANHKEQDGTKEFKAVLKLFNPAGIGTWYLSELDPETNNAFGLCCLTDEELGYVNLDELLEFKGQFGLGIERDKFFKPKPLEDCKRVDPETSFEKMDSFEQIDHLEKRALLEAQMNGEE